MALHRSLATAFVAFGLGLGAGASGATIAAYPDQRTDFVAASGATSIGALPGSGSAHNRVVGAVTFSNGPSGTSVFGSYSNEIGGYDLATSGVENFNMVIAGGAHAIGFDLHEPSYASSTGCNAPCVNSPFRITLLDGTTPLGSVIYDAPNDAGSAAGGPLGFIGLVSTIRFTRVEVRDTSNNIDNEFFGNFLVGQTAPVPELPPAALLLAGLSVVAEAARRARRP